MIQISAPIVPMLHGSPIEKSNSVGEPPMPIDELNHRKTERVSRQVEIQTGREERQKVTE